METPKVIKDMAVEFGKSVKPESLPLISAETSNGKLIINLITKLRYLYFIEILKFIKKPTESGNTGPWLVMVDNQSRG